MPLPFTHATRLASYRKATEDRAVVIDLDDRIVVLVADGAGGITHGGAAADAVVELVRDRAHDLVDVQTCIELLREADHIVQATGGETTAVLLVIDDAGLYGASAGDSEAWIVKDGTVDELTAKQHKKRRIGSGRAVPVGFERIGVEGTVVVGSDGLFRYTTAERIASVVTMATTVDDAAEGLLGLVRTTSNDLLDDVGLAVVMLGADE
jgi:serine/threonine protein phosphatase PrpC